MIFRQTNTFVFDPVKEYEKERDFAKTNPDYRLVGESTTTKIYEKVYEVYVYSIGEGGDANEVHTTRLPGESL